MTSDSRLTERGERAGQGLRGAAANVLCRIFLLFGAGGSDSLTPLQKSMSRRGTPEAQGQEVKVIRWHVRSDWVRGEGLFLTYMRVKAYYSYGKRV